VPEPVLKHAVCFGRMVVMAEFGDPDQIADVLEAGVEQCLAGNLDAPELLAYERAVLRRTRIPAVPAMLWRRLAALLFIRQWSVRVYRRNRRRTEQRFCPIKHAHPPAHTYTRYGRFISYGDAKGYRAQSEAISRSYGDIAPHN
jgi:hypothetical protein